MPTSRSRLFAAFAGAALVSAGLALSSAGAPSFAQSGGDFAGNVVDPVTGFRCVTPFCETVVPPGTDCLCQKNNPNEERLSQLSLTCTVGTGSSRQQCPVTPQFRN